MSSARQSNSSSTARISARASIAPRQWCGPPPPNVTCGLSVRPMSNVNGSSKTSSSRLAERNIDTTRSPFGMVTPSISTSTFVLRVQNATGVDQRSTSSTALGRIASSARYRSISPGFGDERLQSGGQRVLRRVAAREGEHEEEDLELVGGYRQLLAVLVGDHRGRQRAPDVVDRVAPLLRGEFVGVGEDLAEQFELVLLGQLRVRRVRATGCGRACRRSPADPRRGCR